MRTVRFTGSVLGLAMIATAATGGTAGALAPPPNVPPEDAAALEAAVRGYSATFLAGDVAAAYTVLSSDCQDDLSKAEFRRVLRPVAREYGDAQLVSFKITKFSGDRARVTYRYDQSALDVKKEPWVSEDGVWRRDC